MAGQHRAGLLPGLLRCANKVDESPTFLFLQQASYTPSFGGFGLRHHRFVVSARSRLRYGKRRPYTLSLRSVNTLYP